MEENGILCFLCSIDNEICGVNLILFSCVLFKREDIYIVENE